MAGASDAEAGGRNIKPKQGQPVLILLADGSIHEGHWLKNANYREQNVNRWRIYKTGKTVPDSEVIAWVDLSDIIGVKGPAPGEIGKVIFECKMKNFKIRWNLEI